MTAVAVTSSAPGHRFVAPGPPAAVAPAAARGTGGARLALAAMLLPALLAARPASAEWPLLGRAICTAPADQDRAHAASDGGNGAIVTWQDFGTGVVHIFAQHVLDSGAVDAAWPVNGRALLTDTLALATAVGGQQAPVIVPDGTGGAVIAWQDERNDLHGPDVFAQHVLASGEVDPAWPANGVALCVAPGVQDNITLVSDGAGGAIVTWMDGRAGGSAGGSGVDIFAQHVLASGVADPAWSSGGVALCTAPGTQAFPKIAGDGAGGAIVTWYDFRGGLSAPDVYAQRVTAAGVVDPAWPVNGRVLSAAPGSQSDPRIVADGAHGALVAWTDTRDVLSHIYAQRVLGTGAIAPGWPADGLAVCTAPVEQVGPVVATDGAGGAIVAWQDARNGSNHNPYAQHVLASGAVDGAWPINGTALSLSTGDSSDGAIIGDGTGGALVAWEEDSFVMVHHVAASGQLDPSFPLFGRFVRLDLSFQHRPDLVAAGAGNAIVSWANRGEAVDFDVYATLAAAPTTGVPIPGPRGIAFAEPGPNPAHGSLTLRFALPREARVALVVFDAGGRRVRTLVSGVQSAGEHSVSWDLRDDGERPLGAGLYFARLEAEGFTLTRRFVGLR